MSPSGLPLCQQTDSQKSPEIKIQSFRVANKPITGPSPAARVPTTINHQVGDSNCQLKAVAIPDPISVKRKPGAVVRQIIPMFGVRREAVCLLLLLVLAVEAGTDYYEVLGVSRQATKKEVRPSGGRDGVGRKCATSSSTQERGEARSRRPVAVQRVTLPKFKGFRRVYPPLGSAKCRSIDCSRSAAANSRFFFRRIFFFFLVSCFLDL